MKKTLLFLTAAVIFTVNAECGGFYKGIKTNVSTGDVLLSLRDMVVLFDEHARRVGGAGVFYGIKSKLLGLFSDAHREMLENYILRTPEYMLRASGISEDDKDLGGVFVSYCRMMPTAYDTYSTCGEKILRCIKAILPGRDAGYYQGVLDEIRHETGVKWL
ncbi:MAG: hypothetical protein JW994_02615 [Candidatus Omnitrophica bacterium]|nr:hypothetical protein [Candidatus Omnitrophota bacterium]